jgi:hypothetical protein
VEHSQDRVEHFGGYLCVDVAVVCEVQDRLLSKDLVQERQDLRLVLVAGLKGFLPSVQAFVRGRIHVRDRTRRISSLP